jgi:hypothetical protein
VRPLGIGKSGAMAADEALLGIELRQNIEAIEEPRTCSGVGIGADGAGSLPRIAAAARLISTARNRAPIASIFPIVRSSTETCRRSSRRSSARSSTIRWMRQGHRGRRQSSTCKPLDISQPSAWVSSPRISCTDSTMPCRP